MDLPVRIGELKKFLRLHRRKPLSRMGQNFLVDPSAYETILKEGEPSPNDVVLEVGTGSGMLTFPLAERAGAVVTVEMDPFLYDFCSPILGALNNVEMLFGDILESKSRLNPEVVERIRFHLERGRELRIISNPPYTISSPLLITLLTSDLPFRRIVFTLQEEIGWKAAASAGTRDYGPLSVISQIFSRPRIVKRLSARCFWPAPKVDSVIVRFDPRRGRKDEIHDFFLFRRMMKALFAQRRKKAVNALKALEKPPLDRLTIRKGLEIIRALEKRGEELTPDEMIALSNGLSGSAGEA